jgi:hypothetical protein
VADNHVLAAAGTRMRRLYRGSGRALTWRPPATGTASSLDLLTLDPTAGTGALDRWNTNLTGGSRRARRARRSP